MTTITNFRTELPGKLADPTTYQFEPIVSQNRNGKKTTWVIIIRVCTENPDKTEDANGDYADTFHPIIDSWFDSKTQLPPNTVGWTKVLSSIEGGKIKKSNPTYTREGKNIGRSNQTNPFTQALRDALGKYNKQLAKSGDAEATPGPNGSMLYPCMLAQGLADQKNFSYAQPLFAQVKFNGVRMVSTATTAGPVLYTRTRKIFQGFAYLRSDITALLAQINITHPGAYLDGEVYSHGMDLQLISGTARRELDGTVNPDVKLKYYVYDMFVPSEPTLTFSQRSQILNTAAKAIPATDNIVIVETTPVISRDEIDQLYTEALSDKYEGVMVRLDKPYEYSYNDYHSKHLLKVKPVNDGEYRITGITAGTNGKAESALIFELITPAGTKFLVVPGMELPERKRLYAELISVDPTTGTTKFQREYEGKLLTILYDELSSDGVPVRARTEGIVIRDYE